MQKWKCGSTGGGGIDDGINDDINDGINGGTGGGTDDNSFLGAVIMQKAATTNANLLRGDLFQRKA